MKKDYFSDYLKKKDIEEEKVKEFIFRIANYENFLEMENYSIETASFNKLIEYCEKLVANDKDSVLNFLIAMINYANFIKRNDIITQIIDISESYNAMDTLFSRMADYYGENLRDDIFQDMIIPPLGVNPEKKPDFTKKILIKIEEICGEEKVIHLLSPCLHGRPPEDIEGDKKYLKDYGIDAFLSKKYQDLIERLNLHKEEDTLEFAQPIDDEVINFVKANPKFGTGIRDGNVIYLSKLPYQIKKFLNEDDEKMKQFYICYCPWVRGALKNGTSNQIPKYFCQCSAGWYKLYWDQIFGQSIKVVPIKTALDGSLECTFAVYLPESINENLNEKDEVRKDA